MGVNPPSIELRRGKRSEPRYLAECTGGGPPQQATRFWLRDRSDALEAHFEIEDREPWATLAGRDEDLWLEEVVEIFLAPGRATPLVYYEFEVNPLGALFDARVESPHGDRRGLRLDRGWDCPGIVASVDADRPGGWAARLEIPWGAFAGEEATSDWRINLFRIDRPSAGDAEYSAWSPTREVPADFHHPARFGFLRRLG